MADFLPILNAKDPTVIIAFGALLGYVAKLGVENDVISPSS